MGSISEISSYLRCSDIDGAVRKLADSITRDYHDKNPLVIGVLIGTFIFMADLIRKLDFPLEIDFVRLSSYGAGTKSTGDVQLLMEPVIPITGRDVLIVEDIIDTGYSLSYLTRYCKEKGAKSLNVCVLTDKPSRREVPVDIAYTGFTVPDEFLIGYGLDCDYKYRNVPDICIMDKIEEAD